MWYIHEVKTPMHLKKINVLKLLYLHLFCVCACMCVEIRGQLPGAGSLLPPSKFYRDSIHIIKVGNKCLYQLSRHSEHDRKLLSVKN